MGRMSIWYNGIDKYRQLLYISIYQYQNSKIIIKLFKLKEKLYC